tara:strand:- start:1994 stop:2473 length:480 start_codon:yes stop_codon:yes gene_type:complete
MSSWEDIEVSTETRDFEEIENEFIQTGGLSITPEKLHNEFHMNAEHLAEVEQRHKQVLVTSGMIPEEHIAWTEPSLSLKWMVEELNGRINPDGLTIPLMGIELEDFHLSSKIDEQNHNVKISINDGQNDNFERIFSIPKDSIKNELKAHFINNRLYLRW